MSLTSLPYDILYHIVRLLDVEEHVNLGKSCALLQYICSEESLCRYTTKTNIPYAWETGLARNDKIKFSYSQALNRVYERRSALARGVPTLAEIVGSASQFVYDSGLICFQNDDYICILETLNFFRKFFIHISELLEEFTYDPLFPPKLLHCSHSVLSVLHFDRDTEVDYLLVFNINFEDKPLENVQRIQRIRCIRLFNSARIFVRNTEDYLYYGTHSFLGSRNHYEWVVQGVSLQGVVPRHYRPFPEEARHSGPGRTEIESRCVYLTDFTGSGIGSDVAFRIHENSFYAVTNCDDSDVIEVDFTSCYRCVKFPVEDPRVENVRRHRIYRRQHGEGPLHDSWTNLTLQVDERSNDLVIVEARKEWPEGRSRHSRSFYMSTLIFPEPDEDCGTLEPDMGTAPPNSLFASLINHRSTWMESSPRAHWQVHPEEKNIVNDRKGKPPQQFIVAETKFKAYSLSARTFIDVVDDPSCCNSYSDTTKRTSCLRLRTGARQVGPLKLFDPSASKTSSSRSQDPPSTEKPPQPSGRSCYLLPTDRYSPDRNPYTYGPVSLWPSRGKAPATTDDAQARDVDKRIDAAKAPGDGDGVDNDRAHAVLNPIDTNGIDVQAASDDRIVVLLLRDGSCGLRGRGRVDGKLAVLSFDRHVRIPDGEWEECGPGREAARGRPMVCVMEDRPGAGGRVRADGVGMLASSGRTTVVDEDAPPIVENCFKPRKEAYGSDVYAALARAPDDYSDEAQHVELDLSDAEWGW